MMCSSMKRMGWGLNLAAVLCAGLALALLSGSAGAAEPDEQGLLWSWSSGGDACMSIGALPDITGDAKPEIVVGFHSGLVRCFASEFPTPAQPFLTVPLEGAVYSFVALPRIPGFVPARLVAATNAGWVVCFPVEGPNAGIPLWTFKSTCGVNVLAAYPDRNGDSTDEIVAGGADQRVRLLNGTTGAEFWTHYLGTEASGGGYVQALAVAGDLNADSSPDVFVLGWEGKKLWALSGANGSNIWASISGNNYTEALACGGDLTGDGVSDALVGGNDLRLNLYSGANKAEVWYYNFQRPLRAALVTGDVSGDGAPDCFGASAGGLVACLTGSGSGARTAFWTAQMDDGCRALVSPGDLDGDSKPDVAVSTESGSVTALSGATGALLWRWQGADVVRRLVALPDMNGDGKGEVAACSIDGIVAVLSGDPDAWPAPRPVRAPEMAPSPQGANPPEIASEPPAGELEAQAPPAPRAASATAAATDVPILLYHDVLPEMIYTYGVSEENFRTQMDMIVAGGYTCVSLDQIMDWIEGKSELPENPICITFDGPYDGQSTYAMPILRERGLTACVYCTSDWIGGPNRAEWHQMREMENSGVITIENHTIYHANLTTLSQQDAMAQVSLCNDSIRRHLNGKNVLHHAYPGGGYNATVMNSLRAVGMRSAVTVVQRHVVRTDDPMALPRYSVLKTTTAQQFADKIRYTGPIPPPTLTPTPVPTPPPSGQAWILK